jgi:uncharacterized protein YndB with AHSA1/START domain
MTTITDNDVTTQQVYRVWIKATPQAIWEAITTPEWTERYGYTGLAEYDLRPGGAFRLNAGPTMEAAGFGGPMLDGEVVEADPPRRLVQTWRMLMDPGLEAEGFTRLTYEIDDVGNGVSKLTVVHDLAGAPRLAVMVAGGLEDTGAGGGWAWILSDLKSLLEMGKTLAG